MSGVVSNRREQGGAGRLEHRQEGRGVIQESYSLQRTHLKGRNRAWEALGSWNEQHVAIGGDASRKADAETRGLSNKRKELLFF